MPGIAALIGGRAERLALDPLLAGIQVGPTERAAAIAVHGAVLGHVRLGLGGEEGGIARRGPYVLALWGAGPGLVTKANGHGGAPGNGVAPERPLVEERRDRGAADGPQAIADLDGIAACCLYDERTETAYLANDRLGFARLYYRVDGGRLLIASRAAAIADSDALDFAAVGQLLQVGYPLADRTLYAAVKLLPPASFATWHAGQFLIRRLWEPPAPSTAAIGVDEAAAALEQAVTRATERALDPHLRAVLPISGGLDSRLLLGIARRRSELVTLSFGHGHSRDVTFGGRLARVSGTSHRSVPLPSDYMAVLGPRAVYLTEGMAPVESAHMLCLNPALAASPSLLISGFLGGVASGAHLNWVEPGEEAMEPQAAARALFERRYREGFSDDELKRLVRKPFLREMEGAAFDTFFNTYRRGEGAIGRAERVNFELRQRRFVVYQLTLFGATAVVRAPFADRGVVETVLGLPLEARRQQRAYRRLLIKSFPDLARVPHTATGVPLLGPPLGLALRQRLEWCRWKGVARLTHGLVRPHDYRQYAHYGEWIRTAAQSFFADLVADHDHLGDLFDLSAAADLFQAHLDGKVDAHGRLSAFATFALFRRQLARRSTAEPERPAAIAR
jgi:asparagine synthetase B (glutamine-hydrolysing)